MDMGMYHNMYHMGQGNRDRRTGGIVGKGRVRRGVTWGPGMVVSFVLGPTLHQNAHMHTSRENMGERGLKRARVV